MVKTSKENKVQYVAPKAKVFEVRTENALLQASQNGDSWLYSNPNSAGNDMADDDNYTYSF